MRAAHRLVLGPSRCRLATIADYDLIIGMEGGRVVEVGKPEELLALGSGSLFASLYSHM